MKNITIIRLPHQGFCYGVRRSIQLLDEALLNKALPRPIYLLGNLVHNKNIQRYFKEKNIIILDGKSRLSMLDDIDRGTVVFTAHGVSPAVKKKAAQKELTVVDATCPYVEKTYSQIEKVLASGYHLFYIGKKNHPETEAVFDLSTKVTLIAAEQSLPLIESSTPIALAHQTTMSHNDISSIYNFLLTKYNDIKLLDMICHATQTRQDELTLAIKSIPFHKVALTLIIGDRSSNNSTKLMEQAVHLNRSAVWFISGIADIDFTAIRQFDYIIIASGTSTPITIVTEIEQALYRITD